MHGILYHSRTNKAENKKDTRGLIIPMTDVSRKVKQAAALLSQRGEAYTEFVYMLRDIRESYQVSQTEMAEFLDVEQGTVSKFEALELEGKLDFLILYAYALGYHIDMDTVSPDEQSCFQERQFQIRGELSSLKPNHIEDINSKAPRRKVTARSSVVARTRKGLLKKNCRQLKKAATASI